MTDRRKAIRAAAEHLGVEGNAAVSLVNVTGKLSDETFNIMLELLSQPDPHGTICEDIRKRFWSTPARTERFSNWLRDAHLCYHAVNSIIASVLPEHDDAATRIVDGVRHYREQNAAYTDEQILDFSRITAAAFVMMIDNHRSGYFETITAADFHNERFCTFLNNSAIMSLAASNHEKADEIVSVILKHRVFSEPHIMHVLGGGAAALAQGAL